MRNVVEHPNVTKDVILAVLNNKVILNNKAITLNVMQAIMQNEKFKSDPAIQQCINGNNSLKQFLKQLKNKILVKNGDSNNPNLILKTTEYEAAAITPWKNAHVTNQSITTNLQDTPKPDTNVKTSSRTWR